jgi:hypothetical protein
MRILLNVAQYLRIRPRQKTTEEQTPPTSRTDISGQLSTGGIRQGMEALTL